MPKEQRSHEARGRLTVLVEKGVAHASGVAARTAIAHAGAGTFARSRRCASLPRMSARSPLLPSHSHVSFLASGGLAASLLALSLVAGCGDDGGAQPVDAQAPDAALDAPACALDRYPETVRVLSVDLQEETQLTLDGQGTRCEQIQRAVIGVHRPAELHDADVAGATTTCSHDDVTNREIVRIRMGEYGGLPIYWPVQDALLHVDASNKVVFLHGDFLPAGHAPVEGCMSGEGLAAQVPGRPLEYEKFALCVPRGPGSYTIANGDVIEVGDEGIYQDENGGLRRVRAIDVYVAPANLTSEVRNSDAYCCSGQTEEHCVGKTLYLDALTGETVGQAPHCHTC